jgi:glycosyltransferase involved in cell wall biosynthesis
MSVLKSTLALDLTCIALGPLAQNPRGIDRVELAYAEYFLSNWPGECVAVLPTAWGVRYFDRASAIRGLRALEGIWREAISPDSDSAYHRAKSFIVGGSFVSEGEVLPKGKEVLPKGKPLWGIVRDFIRLLRATRISFGKPVKSLPAGAIYLNVGQLLFFRPSLSWLGQRKDVRGIFMVHDLIPLEYPDHHVAFGVKLHRAIVKNSSELASALIVPSQTVRESLSQSFVPPRLATIPTHVELLPVSPAFLRPETEDPALLNQTYYIACGAIDAHKNHILLLQVWKLLVERQGEFAPKLVIAGFRSVTSKPIFDFINQNHQIRQKVYIASGLSTPSLRKLMMSAKALLMPSIVEGFGLPVIEALAQGTPVIASDIPSLREAGRNGDVVFLPPTDPMAWLSAIEAFNPEQDSKRATTAYSPKTWQDYFVGIENFLTEVAASPKGFPLKEPNEGSIFAGQIDRHDSGSG